MDGVGLRADTVPVERSTVSQWKEGPFSGKYVSLDQGLRRGSADCDVSDQDGTYVWGRGSCDGKSCSA